MPSYIIPSKGYFTRLTNILRREIISIMDESTKEEKRSIFRKRTRAGGLLQKFSFMMAIRSGFITMVLLFALMN